MVGRAELVHRIAARGASVGAAGHAVQAVLDELTAAVAAGEKVTITGFGTFDPVARPARTARNPRTGAAVQVPAGVIVRFRPGAGLRAAVDAGTHPLGPVGALPAPVASGSASDDAAHGATTSSSTKPTKVTSKATKPATASSKAKDAKAKDAKAKDAKAKDAKAKDAKRSPAKKGSKVKAPKSKGSKH